MRIIQQLFTGAVCLMACSCSTKMENNPFLVPSDAPYGAPRFDLIRLEHYEPAVLEGISRQNQAIEAIVQNPEAPDFDNTIAALDASGDLLSQVSLVLFNMADAETSDELTDLSIRLAPMLAEHADNIYLNPRLFARVEAVHRSAQADSLTSEQRRLLDKHYKAFVRSGAGLPAEKQDRLRQINQELSTLTLQFSNHVLAENNTFQLLVDDASRLEGAPSWVLAAAADEARQAGHEGKWMFTLRSSSFLPAMQYVPDRDVRRQLYEAYTNRCNHGGETDNKELLVQIIRLRLEKARLLGYDHYADFVLSENMAHDARTVNTFLAGLWDYALPKAKAEAAELQGLLQAEQPGATFEAWDWWYYAEKLRRQRYAVDEDELKPYFRLENVRDGAFAVAQRLYGITLTPAEGVPVYHPDVQVFEVKDADGSFLALFYTDYFPRPGKRGGAWMSNYREQSGGVRPFVCNVASFTKPTADLPSLLTLDEVETTFHEFGHALHGILTQCRYVGTSGTNVARDFVELPSQLFEHWATEPEVLRLYARHYQTGEVIPDSLIRKIQAQGTFNQGFMTTELLAAAILDMDLHQVTDAADLDVAAFERREVERLGLIPQIAPRYRLTYFNHIMGGYEAGYYSYLWANVLDADAYEAFREKGVFDEATATSLRRNILERGNSEDPMVLYRRFRGADPRPEPMLVDRGLR